METDWIMWLLLGTHGVGIGLGFLISWYIGRAGDRGERGATTMGDGPG